MTNRGFEHRSFRVKATSGPLQLRDAATGREFPLAPGCPALRVKAVVAGLELDDGEYQYGPLPGSISLSVPAAPQLIEVDFPDRQYGGKPGPGSSFRYRGELTIEPLIGKSACLVVNSLPIEMYLLGIAEMRADWPQEALRAQIVAARTYALSQLRDEPGRLYDVRDSTASQVYLGHRHERPLLTAAVEATSGIVLTAGLERLIPYYCSSSGGHTEHREHVFASKLVFPGESASGLRGRFDGPGPFSLDLSLESDARRFYGSTEFQTSSFDAAGGENPLFRWTMTIGSREEVRHRIQSGLRGLAGSPFVQPTSTAETSPGDLLDLVIPQRGISGKAMELLVTTAHGRWAVRTQLCIRRLLGRSAVGGMALSANVVFDLVRDNSGRVTTLTAHGGGSGHGVGMSQWGARGMALAGHDHTSILSFYYQSATLVDSRVDGGSVPRDASGMAFSNQEPHSGEKLAHVAAGA